jgi:hypothetical protein
LREYKNVTLLFLDAFGHLREYKNLTLLFLDAFATLRKATVFFVLTARPHEQLGSYWTDCD